jgi:type II restriction enzyme and methylase
MRETLNSKKNRGGYYTPKKLTDFISKWAIEKPSDKVLEPSAGDGGFVNSAYEVFKSMDNQFCTKQCLAIESNEFEASKIDKKKAKVVNLDFFEYFQAELQNKETFDVILGNPPFIRYQSIDRDVSDRAFDSMKYYGFTPNKMTNLWAPFLLLSSELITDGGRLGMVIPAELLQVDYAADIRSYLLEKFQELTLISFNDNLFEGAQQEVVVLLGKTRSENKGFRFIELDSLNDLDSFDLNDDVSLIKDVEVSRDKWLKYFLKPSELSNFKLAISHKNLHSFNDIAEVNVGIVTGQNEFFVVNKQTVESFGLESNSLTDIISRAEQLKGIELNESRLQELYKDNKKVKMFIPKKLLSNNEKNYILFGESNGYHLGYKTRIRKEWYRVPLTWFPEAFFLRQVHEYPKIVVNNTKAVNTDTLHKVRANEGFDIYNISLSFLNSLTLLQCELSGRSYGGGVLTFEPGEVRSLKLPYYQFNDSEKKVLINLLEDSKFQQAVDIIDNIILKDKLNFSEQEIFKFKSGWHRLKSRRLNRKKRL